jgi:osmotically-inducible protein OsmY
MIDVELQDHVIDELASDPRIDASGIAIVSSGGVVTLSGTVRSLTDKWQAIEDVKSVRGVSGVADELVLDLPLTHQRTDSDIARAIAVRFDSSNAVPDSVKFIVKDGSVTLSGVVSWNFERDEAIREVRTVAGVGAIVDQLLIEISPPPSAEAVRRRVHSLFSRYADRTANDIFVTVEDGSVILRGSVHTWTERDRAAQAAWSFRGVTRVDNRLEVAP